MVLVYNFATHPTTMEENTSIENNIESNIEKNDSLKMEVTKTNSAGEMRTRMMKLDEVVVMGLVAVTCLLLGGLTPDGLVHQAIVPHFVGVVVMMVYMYYKDRVSRFIEETEILPEMIRRREVKNMISAVVGTVSAIILGELILMFLLRNACPNFLGGDGALYMFWFYRCLFSVIAGKSPTAGKVIMMMVVMSVVLFLTLPTKNKYFFHSFMNRMKGYTVEAVMGAGDVYVLSSDTRGRIANKALQTSIETKFVQPLFKALGDNANCFRSLQIVTDGDSSSVVCDHVNRIVYVPMDHEVDRTLFARVFEFVGQMHHGYFERKMKAEALLFPPMVVILYVIIKFVNSFADFVYSFQDEENENEGEKKRISTDIRYIIAMGLVLLFFVMPFMLQHMRIISKVLIGDVNGKVEDFVKEQLKRLDSGRNVVDSLINLG